MAPFEETRGPCVIGAGAVWPPGVLKSLPYKYIVSQRRYSIMAANHPHRGHPQSAETRQKISDANMGREVSQATRDKISAAEKGRTLSAETREKISESLKGNQNAKR